MTKTQRDVAKRFGVSQMTISRALNDRPGVSQKLKKKILFYIEKQVFSTNRIAGSLASGRTKIIGLLVPSVSYSFFPEITDRIEELCRKQNYNTILCHTGEDYERMVKEIRLLMGLRVAGLIITPPARTQKIAIYVELTKKKIPFVFIDRYLSKLENSYVVTDARKGAYEAVKYLIGIGHRKILFIKGPPKTSSAREVYSGYVKALKENELEKNVISGGFEEKDSYKAIKEMINKNIKPTAIMAVNDPAAIGALEAFHELKVKVPDDISLVGFSDIAISSKIKVPLTTVREDTESMGEKAASILFRMIEERKKIIEKIRLAPKLIIRESTKAI